MKQLMREPLVHFLLLGAAIFVAYSLVSRGSSGEGGKIVVTQGQLASIWESFTRTRQREPTSEEWVGLQQKLEFVTDDVVPQAQPSDDELNAHLQAHPDKFRVEPRFTFRQVFVDPQKHGKSLARDAARLLAQLNQADGNTEISVLGDPLMLDHQFGSLTSGEVARLFGDAFAKAVSGLSPGQWHGPVESSFGVHLVFVSERSEGRMPTLADVRDAVRREWEDAHRLEAKEMSYREMLRRYTVTVESPEPVPATVASISVK